jgi:hypothetical protein
MDILRGTYILALFKEGDIEVSGPGYKRISVKFDANSDSVHAEFGPIKKEWGKLSYIGLMDPLNPDKCLLKIFVKGVKVRGKISSFPCPETDNQGGEVDE